MPFFKKIFGRNKRRRRPCVVVDFVIEKSVIYLSILNVSKAPAFDVCILFDGPIKGQNGTRNLAEIPLVKNIPYLAPFKSIRLMIDPVEIFYYHLAQSKLEVDIHYKDKRQRSCKDRASFDLDIYRDLPADSRVDFL